MKRFTQIIALLFAAISLQAQKIDTRLISLLPTGNMPMSIGGASASEEIDTAAVKSDINVRFNPDCTVRSFSAIAMLAIDADSYREATSATVSAFHDNFYNTLGQRVSKHAKGIIIHQGRLYVNP